MKLIEIPFVPNTPEGWTIPVPGDGERQFASREEALGFARTLASEKPTRSSHNVLCVEGADGRWRLFTADLTPFTAVG